MDFFQKEEKLEISIQHHRDALSNIKTEAKQVVQGIYQHYLLNKQLSELPPHIKPIVEFLDKFAYGKDV
jgi:hypothetical protein